MFDKFNQAKQLYDLKKQADSLKKELGVIFVEADYQGVVVKMKGDQEVVSVVVDGQENIRLVRAFNKALTRSQKEAAKKMRSRLGDFGLPNL